jgi:hypothetical protein
MPDTDTTVIIDRQLEALLATPVRDRWRWARACTLAAITAATIAWVSVCVKVIWACWG